MEHRECIEGLGLHGKREEARALGLSDADR